MRSGPAVPGSPRRQTGRPLDAESDGRGGLRAEVHGPSQPDRIGSCCASRRSAGATRVADHVESVRDWQQPVQPAQVIDVVWGAQLRADWRHSELRHGTFCAGHDRGAQRERASRRRESPACQQPLRRGHQPQDASRAGRTRDARARLRCLPAPPLAAATLRRQPVLESSRPSHWTQRDTEVRNARRAGVDRDSNRPLARALAGASSSTRRHL